MGILSRIFPVEIRNLINLFGVMGSKKSLYETMLFIYPFFCSFFKINDFENAISSGSNLAFFLKYGYVNIM